MKLLEGILLASLLVSAGPALAEDDATELQALKLLQPSFCLRRRRRCAQDRRPHRHDPGSLLPVLKPDPQSAPLRVNLTASG